MRLLQMADSSTPPDRPFFQPVYAFYLGGQTPHVWSAVEVEGLTARWGLPIWVNTNPYGDAVTDADVFTEVLTHHGIAPGVSVALDTEDQVQDTYIKRFDNTMTGHGYDLIHYESRGVDGQNPPTSGGKWIAQWPGNEDLPDGAVANQYMNAAEAGQPWDCSVISSEVKLHEIHPVTVPVSAPIVVTTVLHALNPGDTGFAVRQLQALLTGAMPTAPQAPLSDGVFGPITRSWLEAWQHYYGVGKIPGVADADTWASLLTRS